MGRNERNRMQQRTRRVAVCAMLIALGVVIICLGALIEVLDLCTAAFASLLSVLVVIEYGKGYPWAVYAATVILSLLLSPQKSPALVYTAFGFYPILKEKLERLPRIVCCAIKSVIFIALEVMLITVADVLTMADEVMPTVYYIALYILGFITLWLFDIAMTRLITLYLKRYRNRLKKLF